MLSKLCYALVIITVIMGGVQFAQFLDLVVEDWFYIQQALSLAFICANIGALGYIGTHGDKN